MRADGIRERVASFLTRFPKAPTVWVAYSGGLDSSVLLDACTDLSRNGSFPALRAVHVHHGLHPDAETWAAHCAAVCERYALPFTLRRVQVARTPGTSLEEAARQARYDALCQLLAPHDLVLLAHHQDDQAETLLLQLLRGAGVKGLAAMPEVAPLGAGLAVRPLLKCARDQLAHYANERGLSWIDDPSNTDRQLNRNYLRHEIIPMLRQRWPAASSALSRSAGHCAEAQHLLAEQAQHRLSHLVDPTDRSLSIAELESMSDRERRWLVREWLQGSGCRMPSAAVLERIVSECITARDDAQPEVVWADYRIHRYRRRLYVLVERPADIDRTPMRWICPSEPLLLPGNGRLIAEPTEGPGIPFGAWHCGGMWVRYRQIGEVCNLPERGRRPLKKLLQECHVPPWDRDRIPLIFSGEALVAVGNAWRVKDLGDASDRKLLIRWLR